MHCRMVSRFEKSIVWLMSTTFKFSGEVQAEAPLAHASQQIDSLDTQCCECGLC
jgi:hypothetical protein